MNGYLISYVARYVAFPTDWYSFMVGEMVQNSQSLYAFTFNVLIDIHEYICSHSTTEFTSEIYLFTFTCVFLIHDNIFSHLRDVFIHIQRVISIHIQDRNSPGADPGEVKRVNFHPPPSPFIWAPLFLFFLIPQILIGSNTLSQKFTPPFQNPGSAPVSHSAFSAHHLCASVSIKHGPRTTDYGLRITDYRLGIKHGLRYKRRTKHYGLGIKYGLRYKTRTVRYGLGIKHEERFYKLNKFSFISILDCRTERKRRFWKSQNWRAVWIFEWFKPWLNVLKDQQSRELRRTRRIRKTCPAVWYLCASQIEA